MKTDSRRDRTQREDGQHLSRADTVEDRDENDCRADSLRSSESIGGLEMNEHSVSRPRERFVIFLALAPWNSPCRTGAVTTTSRCPTRDSCFRRMYFPANLSFSVHGPTVLEKEKDENLYRR